MMTFVFT